MLEARIAMTCREMKFQMMESIVTNPYCLAYLQFTHALIANIELVPFVAFLPVIDVSMLEIGRVPKLAQKRHYSHPC